MQVERRSQNQTTFEAEEAEGGAVVKTPTYRPLSPPSPLALRAQPQVNPPPALLLRAVLGLRKLLLWLADRLCPAELALLDHTIGLGRTHALGAIANLNVVDVLGDKRLSAEELALSTGLHADALFRTLRALSSRGIFDLHADGRFANNRLSRVLQSGRASRAREWAIYFASGSNAAAWSDLQHTLETGESPFDRVHNTTVWEWFEQHPDEREIFAHLMMGITLMDAPVIATRYPFDEVARLCDVGGGRGTLLSELLLRFPALQGALLESPTVIESARELLTARGVIERVELLPGSFFERVPAGYDAYVLKNVLHDWDDATCERILGQVRAAMKPGARVLVCEALVEKLCRDPLGTLPDLQMMVACSGGRERSRVEYRALLDKVGLVERRVFEYPTISVIEAVARG